MGESLKALSTEKHSMKCVCAQRLASTTRAGRVSKHSVKTSKCGESLRAPSTEKHSMKCVCAQSLGARQLYVLYSRFLNQPHSGSAAPRLHLHASRSISWRSCRETPAETAIQPRERHRQRTGVCAPPACVSWRQIARDHAERET